MAGRLVDVGEEQFQLLRTAHEPFGQASRRRILDEQGRSLPRAECILVGAAVPAGAALTMPNQ
ncbi:hypothetical protein ACZ91_05730 [Streptomyces regensis]|nr:hypothetical protein ACZ91_05730 [Streptomyces regensis]KOG75953.1 hypothetical protein ADK77_00465 [Streptomyces antibioticus]